MSSDIEEAGQDAFSVSEPTEKLILGAHEKLLSHFQTDTKRDTADKKKRCLVA
jgi:hypothetical protein